MTPITANLKTYRVFIAMHHRCKSPKSPSYPRYGGRGIRVCARWASFEQFLADMGPQPEGMVLDRENNDGDYEPSNCRWVTRKDSARNTSANRVVEAFGQAACVSEWAERSGINKTTLLLRLNRGWSPEAAVTVGTGPKADAFLQQLAPLMKQAGLLS